MQISEKIPEEVKNQKSKIKCATHISQHSSRGEERAGESVLRVRRVTHLDQIEITHV
jgi:hypothetical protein